VLSGDAGDKVVMEEKADSGVSEADRRFDRHLAAGNRTMPV
jgi:hypothetical protein